MAYEVLITSWAKSVHMFPPLSSNILVHLFGFFRVSVFLVEQAQRRD